jgi:hypothetical protein
VTSFPLSLHTKTLYALLFPHMCYMSCSSHSSWFDHPNNIWLRAHIIKLHIRYSSPFPSPSYAQISSSASCPKTPSVYVPHTPTQNNRQNYSSLCFNLDKSGLQTGGHKFLERMRADFPRVQSDLIFLWTLFWFEEAVPKSSPQSQKPYHLSAILNPSCILSTVFGPTLLSFSVHNNAQKKRIKVLGKKTGAQNIVKEIKHYQQKWLQHVERVGTNILPKQALNYRPEGRRNLGRPKKR